MPKLNVANVFFVLISLSVSNTEELRVGEGGGFA